MLSKSNKPRSFLTLTNSSFKNMSLVNILGDMAAESKGGAGYIEWYDYVEIDSVEVDSM